MYPNIIYNCLSRKYPPVKGLLQKFSASFGETASEQEKALQM